MDEGNAVVEAAQAPQVSAEQQPTNQDANVIVSDSEGSREVPNITEPIAETGAADIGATESQPQVEAPAMMQGSNIDDVQVIEMLNQVSRGSVYSKEELIKAGMDSELSSAVAYNEVKERQLALDEYEVLNRGSIIRAEHTGYFLSPEDTEMIRQKKYAEQQLKSGNITDLARNKAKGVIAQSNSYFKSKNISEKGVKTLEHILKELELNVERSRVAAASASLNNMIRATEEADLKAVHARLQKGETPKAIAAMMKESTISKEDIFTIAEAYYSVNDPNIRAKNIISNVKPFTEDFNLWAEETDKRDTEGNKVYSITVDDRTQLFTIDQDNEANPYTFISKYDLKDSGSETSEVNMNIRNVRTEDVEKHSDLRRYAGIAKVNESKELYYGLGSYRTVADRTKEGKMKSSDVPELLDVHKEFLLSSIDNDGRVGEVTSTGGWIRGITGTKPEFYTYMTDEMMDKVTTISSGNHTVKERIGTSDQITEIKYEKRRVTYPIKNWLDSRAPNMTQLDFVAIDMIFKEGKWIALPDTAKRNGEIITVKNELKK